MENKVMNENDAIDAYKESMTEYDKIAYEIAISQLESSFDIVKSIGFQDFISKNNIIVKN